MTAAFVDTDRPHLVVRLYQDDAGHIHGTVVPPHHRIPDVSGYGVEASPAAWKLLEDLVAPATARDAPAQPDQEQPQ